MKTILFTFFMFVFIISLNLNLVRAQQKETENKIVVTGEIRGQQRMEQHGVAGMQMMSGTTDSSTTTRNIMDDMKQVDAEDMRGGQMGIDAMVGTAQSLRGMADQMKMINQHLNNMMTNKEIMDNKACAENINEMRTKMAQTSSNLNKINDLNQKMMGSMQKQD